MTVKKSPSLLSRAFHDLKNRLKGLLAETRARLKEKAIPDDILVDRIRSRLGHVVSRPDLIEVLAEQGSVSLTGAIPAKELRPALRAIHSVRGVDAVYDRLSVEGNADRRQIRKQWKPGQVLGFAIVSISGSLLFVRLARILLRRYRILRANPMPESS